MTHAPAALIQTAALAAFNSRSVSDVPGDTPNAEFRDLLAGSAPAIPGVTPPGGEPFRQENDEAALAVDEAAEETAEEAIESESDCPPECDMTIPTGEILASEPEDVEAATTADGSAASHVSIDTTISPETFTSPAAHPRPEVPLIAINDQSARVRPHTHEARPYAALDPQPAQLSNGARQVVVAPTPDEPGETGERISLLPPNRIELAQGGTRLDHTRDLGAQLAAKEGFPPESAAHERACESTAHQPSNGSTQRIAGAAQFSPLLIAQSSAPIVLDNAGTSVQPAHDEAGARAPLEFGAPAQAVSQAINDTRSISTIVAPEARQAAASLAEGIRTQGAGTTEIHLSPEELGRVRLVIATSEKGTNVTIIAERLETSEFLRRNVEVMHRTCRDMGLGETQISFADRQQPHPERGQPEPASTQETPVPNSQRDELYSPPTHNRVISLDRVDLRL